MSRTKKDLTLYVMACTLVFLMAVPLFDMMATGLTFGFQQRITSDNADQGRIRMAAVGSGDTSNVFLVYEDKSVALSSYHIVLKRSTNGGRTFDNTFDFLADWTDTRQQQRWPSIAIHEGISTTTLAVVYMDNTPDPFFLDYTITCRISTDLGATWSADYTVVTEVANNWRDIQATFDPNGNLFVIYTKGAIGVGYYYICYSTDFGQTWSAPEQVPLPPGHEDTQYKQATLAADGSYLGIAFQSNPDWKAKIYFVRAPTTSLGIGMLSWDPDVLLINYLYGTKNPEGWLPVLTAEKDVFHIAWWDFETDAGGGYEGRDTLTRDRPCIKYSRSTDHGDNFKVGTKIYTKVNETQSPAPWISAPSMDTSASGLIAIAWVEVYQGNKNIYVTTSNDGGVSWSKKTRINSFYPEYEIAKWFNGQDSATENNPDVTFKVAVDRSDGIHSSWLAEPLSEDRELFYSRNIINAPPEAIDDLFLRGYEEFYGDVGWTINREPDFMEYRTHISTEPDFIPNYTPFPTGTLYNISTKQSMNYELFKDLQADTTYYVKVEVVDDQNLSTASNQVSFKTLPINVPPWYNETGFRDLFLPMPEDSRIDKAINLTDWVDYSPLTEENKWVFPEGKYIKDDYYNGVTDLYFEIESEKESPIVLATLYDEWHGKSYYYVDFFANPAWEDKSGVERFRLIVSDPGKDGSLLTVKDNKVSKSPWFNVTVISTNDLPEWVSFTDLNIGTGRVTLMDDDATELVLDDLNTSCIEEQEYKFKLTCRDVDGDFIEMDVKIGDPMENRFPPKPRRDDFNPRTEAVFTFTPIDDDLPVVRFNITADDEKGGLRNLTIVLPIKNLNDEPFFLTVNEIEVDRTGDTVRFLAAERSELSFNVTGWDIDPNEALSISPTPSSVKATKLMDGHWRISYRVPTYNKLTSLFSELKLLLRDRQGSYAELDVNITILDVPEPPTPPLSGIMYSLDYSYDETDPNEWPGKNKIQVEWGEPVNIEGFALDPDGDVLNYTWRISNMKESMNWTLTGKKVTFRFYPTEKPLTAPGREKFRINLSVSDGIFDPIYDYFETWVDPDDDNDNDGLPDFRELWFYNLVNDPESGRPEMSEVWKDYVKKGGSDSKWTKWADQVMANYENAGPLLTTEVEANPLLLFSPDDDIDKDQTEDGYRYKNYEEIGLIIPQQVSEEQRVPRINSQVMNPLDPLVWPGHPNPEPPIPEGVIEEKGIPTWAWVAGSIVALIIIAAVITVVVILRREKVIEKKEDEDLEKRVKDHEKRQAVIQGLYGVQKAGDAIGPDQSTLKDLTLDLGGQVYHEEGSTLQGLKKKEHEEVKKGPLRQAVSGPHFEASAPKLDFGESLKLETMDIDSDVTQMDHSGIDEEAVDSSMEDLFEAAEDYDPNAVKNAGGNVLVGAVPMEEQMRIKQQGAQNIGPRLPPPGQEGAPLAHPPRPPLPGAPPLPQQMPPKRPK